MSFILDHTKLGFCWWDLIAFLALVAICVYCFSKIKQMKEEKKALEEKLTGDAAAEAVDAAAAVEIEAAPVAEAAPEAPKE